MQEDIKKTVDQSWKNQVNKEKQQSQQNQETFYEPNFTILVSSLSMQAMISMGKLENPMTKTAEENLDQARFLIDSLAIIEEKTKGNLTDEEKKFLEDSLFHLRMNYIEIKDNKDKGKSEPIIQTP